MPSAMCSAMLSAVTRLPTGRRLLPFLSLSYGRPGAGLWHDGEGKCREIVQGEGGEQGEALMPALFSLGLADSLKRAQARLLPGELLFAYLDDLYVVTKPERAGAAYLIVTDEVRSSCGIEPNLGKTMTWNRAGIFSPEAELVLGGDASPPPFAFALQTLAPSPHGKTAWR